jgi:hypothetical protein
MAKERLTFHKSYLATWSEEIFKIKSIIKRKPIVYTLVDDKNEPVAGTFYAQELVRVIPTGVFRIEQIVGRRVTEAGERQLQVKWQGYKEKTWINETDIVEPAAAAAAADNVTTDPENGDETEF